MTADAGLVRPQVDTSSVAVNLTGKTVVVTGGGSGIGAAIAACLASSGARVVIMDRDVQAANSVAASIEGSVAVIRCDVTSTTSIKEAVEAATKELGGIDILVNSAGIARLAVAEDLDDQAWAATLAVNLTGTFTMCREVGKVMLQRGRGKIINLASQAASVALPEHAAYGASKHGVVGLTQVLALEWAGRGVTANTISPTVVLTPLGLDAWNNEKGLAHQAEIPVGRFAAPEEIATIAAFLASDVSDMINGADIKVDGGFTIR